VANRSYRQGDTEFYSERLPPDAKQTASSDREQTGLSGPKQLPSSGPKQPPDLEQSPPSDAEQLTASGPEELPSSRLNPASLAPVPPDKTCKELPKKTDCIVTIDAEGREKKVPRHFYLAYIEFDDMGELWSIGNLNNSEATSAYGKDPAQATSQLGNALDVIREAKLAAGKRPLDVVTFIHGWHNNASSYDERHKNLKLFKTDLQMLADGQYNPVVVGIFIAWRGQSQTGDLFDTYWDRREAATRLGGVSMTEVLFKLMFATKGVLTPPTLDNKCRPGGLEPRAHFVAIGHSFGARILERAMGQPLLAMILQQKYEADKCAADAKEWNKRHPAELPIKPPPNLLAPADLIVFLNPANDAFETKSMIEAFKRSGITSGDDYRLSCANTTFCGPLMVSMTSWGDLATRKLMPVAQGLSPTVFNDRPYDPDRCAKGQLDLHYQTLFWRQSDGDIEQMHSYDVVQEGKVVDCENKDWRGVRETVKDQPICFVIERLPKTEASDKKLKACYGDADPKPWNNTPLWVIGIHRKLIKNHTDIFGPGTLQLLTQIAQHFNSAESAPTTAVQASSTSYGHGE
jgi:hypothetical protein